MRLRSMDFIKLTHDVLSVEEATSLVTHPSCGAVSLFVGTTRDNFEGKVVVELEYEAYHEMAEKEMRKLCAQTREKWKVKHIALHHRLGLVPVTESSIIVAVSSEHRRESLDAVSFLIDHLKARVPIWKKERYCDGSGDWKKNKECVWLKTKGDAHPDAKEMETVNNNKRSLSDESDSRSKQPQKKIKEEIKSDSEDEELSAEGGRNSDQQRTRPEETSSSPPSPHREEIDPRFIQIAASKQEINRRIAAFQQRKREELDVMNVQEFCMLSGGPSSSSSCARTSAVVLRSKGSNSHLKLTRVVNDWGPQTLGMDPGSMSTSEAKEILKQEGGNSSGSGSSREGSLEPGLGSLKDGSSEVKCQLAEVDHPNSEKLPSGIAERLHNLENHLRIVPGRPVPRDVYARLKMVEERLLFLEGISPEYFRNNRVITRKPECVKEIKATEDDISLDELDAKIHAMKMKLKQKQIKQEF